MNDIPEKFPLSWLNTQTDYDSQFSAEALAILERLASFQPERIRPTYTTASSASALINHWLCNRDLPAYERGRIVEDFAALIVTEYDGCLAKGIENLCSFIDIKRDEIVALMEQENMTVPAYLGGKVCAASANKVKNKWGEHELQKLYRESIEVGITTEKLAARYGITRQGIEKQIDKAKEKLIPKKPSPFDVVRNKKKF